MLSETTVRDASRAVHAVKVYGSGPTAVTALDNVDVEFGSGRFTAIMGPSGSGKSTLLHCLAGLDNLTSGEIFIGDTNVTALDEKGKTLLRREKLGFIFQSFNLIPTLSAEENILLPMALARIPTESGSIRSSTPSVCATDSAICRPSCQAVSSSALPRRAPSRTVPRSSSQTSRRGTSTRARRPRSWSS
jgi:putative ABC transport system ATP-binding protein